MLLPPELRSAACEIKAANRNTRTLRESKFGSQAARLRIDRRIEGLRPQNVQGLSCR